MVHRPGRQTPMLWLSALSIMCSVLPALVLASRFDGVDVFALFTQHIRRQTDSDKRAFAQVSQCMNWFYRREREKKPAPPAVQGISGPANNEPPGIPVQSQEECEAHYPGGLDTVRKDFQRTQTSLSVSLTFYEFALVGDGDDNGAYSSNELRDVLQALNLPAESAQGADGHVKALTGSFDAMHHSRSLESLMAGMSKLYELGYRFTSADKATLDRIME
jgi:hypothetical protein